MIVKENFLYEAIADVKKYYPNIDDDTFMEIIALDPTYTGKDSVGKYSKWLLNLYNRGKISENDFDEIPDLLNQFTIYRNRIQNKDLNAYKTLDDLAEILASVVDDDSMLTPSQKTKFLKRVKSGKIKVDKSDDYDIVLDTPNFIVYVPNTHEASMNLGNGTEWCTAHENPDWYNHYTENGRKLYIVKNKKTGERWQYSDKSEDFLDENDNPFDILQLMSQDEKLSKFFEQFLGMDYYNFDGTWVYNGKKIPNDLKPFIENIIILNNVTSIGIYAFSRCSNLTSITIPNSVTSIGDEAFSYCTSLTSITIPDSVIRIGVEAFSRCSSLTDITIPDSVTYIGNAVFHGCLSLTNITIGNSVTYIGFDTFRGCTNLTSVIIPDSVTNIGHCVFSGCTRLKSITIPNSVTRIGNDAFYGCRSLTSITIPNSVTSIGHCVFSGCSSLTSITIPDNVTTIYDEAFENCSSLKNITIPDSVISIRYSAFYGCSNLTSITIPNSVTNIGDEAFDNCNNLTVYTDNKYVIDYCEDNDIQVKSLSAKNESLKRPNRLKLRIREI